ncbi:uncharacterized protein LOC119675246 [Teleopsis dalmanni]|uniref:uncharacterized protein LOC119671673 n=1 Tax=Teleopsis dalmanni TaxID=139649 RepID=UPI0018CF7B4F|nr:uncharacterized protein LOC119671673 [Teleopsis dalmanni]XP_037942364.1 uncharacterized protein LOC119675246 [Teleopsis dalmanni]
MLNWLCIFLVIFISHQINATDYEIIGDDSCFFTRCSKEDNKGNVDIMTILDVSNLKHEYSDDLETVRTNGKIMVKGNMPKNVPIRVELELLRWQHGQWVETSISIRRNDFCKSVFDPTEIWYDYMNNLAKNDRDCPPKKGKAYLLKNVLNRVIVKNVPMAAFPGQYKAIMHLISGNFSTCISSRMHLNRK